MIPPHILSLAMWSVMTLWAATAVGVLLEFRRHRRKGARAADLMQQLTAGGSPTSDQLPDLTRSEFQDLVLKGLPHTVEVAIAQELRWRAGDEALLTLATGGTRAPLDERINALQVMASGLHPQRYRVLAAALRSEPAELAAVALRLLRELDDDEAARTLVDALAEGVYSASRVAAALERMTAERASLLGPLLLHSSTTMRFWGLRLAGRTGASRWIGDVRESLTDREPIVRRAAVEAIGRLGSVDDEAAVLARFLDSSPMVRVHAARASVAFGNGTVAEALVKLLTDRQWIVRAAARESLLALGETATPVVTQALWHDDEFAANNAAEVLFRTGVAIQFIHGVLDRPQDARLCQLAARFMTVSGPYIVRAIDDQLDAAQRAALRRIVRETLAALAAERDR
jgi:HEAT repeat protein